MSMLTVNCAGLKACTLRDHSDTPLTPCVCTCITVCTVKQLQVTREHKAAQGSAILAQRNQY